MSAAVAEKPSGSRRVMPGRPADLPSRTEAAGPADNLIESARLGAERLARMSHDELRQEIARRVYMLENELKEREERRAAIEEALVAQRVLDGRRARARRIRRKVNIGSSLVAAMFTGLVVAGMF